MSCLFRKSSSIPSRVLDAIPLMFKVAVLNVFSIVNGMATGHSRCGVLILVLLLVLSPVSDICLS